jgi:hypothetical protein
MHGGPKFGIRRFPDETVRPAHRAASLLSTFARNGKPDDEFRFQLHGILPSMTGIEAVSLKKLVLQKMWLAWSLRTEKMNGAGTTMLRVGIIL